MHLLFYLIFPKNATKLQVIEDRRNSLEPDVLQTISAAGLYPGQRRLTLWTP